MVTASVIVYVYAVLVGLGGVFGFVKAKSLPSLIMGGVSCLVLIAAGYGLRSGQSWGQPLALGMAAVLLVFFLVRFLRSVPRAIMPGGLMALLSLLTLVGVAGALHSR